MASVAQTKARAQAALDILTRDEDRMDRIDRYMHGEHDDPYMPDMADEEYREIARKSITNITEFIVGAPVQAMYVDSFRRGDPREVESDGEDTIQPEWKHWQESRLDSLQHPIYRAAFGFGHSFTVTEEVKGRVLTRGLSPLRTTAVYENPASDDNAIYAFTAVEWPTKVDGETVGGYGYLWDQYDKWRITWGQKGLKAKRIGAHGGEGENPVTRFAGIVDLEGETHGIVEPMIPLQDRLNQQVFDLLICGTYGSFQLRGASGMAAPIKTKAVFEYEDGKGPNAVYDSDGNLTKPDYGDVIDATPVLDPNTGQPIPEAVNINSRRFLMAEDPDTKFFSLDGTPLEGYVSAIRSTFEQIAALSQTPPNYMLGEIANLSAEALQSAEQTLLRKVAEFQSSFGESWERVFRIASKMAGDPIGTDDYSGEVIWRDVGKQSLVGIGDALSKMAQNLEVPPQALWAEIPGMTAQKLAQWKQMADDQDSRVQLLQAQQRAASSLAPTFREAAPTPATASQ